MRRSFWAAIVLLAFAFGPVSGAQSPSAWAVSATEFRYVDQLSTPSRVRSAMRRFTREEGIPDGRLVDDFGGSDRLVAGVTARSTEVFLRVGRKLATLIAGPADATAEGVEVSDRPDGRVAIRFRWVWSEGVRHETLVCQIDPRSSDCVAISVTTRRNGSVAPPPNVVCRDTEIAIECEGETRLSRSLASLFARNPNTGRGVDLGRSGP
jgi:hypothetical protein